MSKYTQGKWKVLEGTKYRTFKVKSDGIIVAELNTEHYGSYFANDLTAQANAHLIASAPELLEGCKEVLCRIVGLLETNCECDNTHQQNGTTCFICALTNTINKAEGKE